MRRTADDSSGARLGKAALGLFIAAALLVAYLHSAPASSSPAPLLQSVTTTTTDEADLTATTTAAPTCMATKTASACDASPKCTWCVSYAIPSACYDLEDASQLPDGVFECHNKDVVVAAPSCSTFKSPKTCDASADCVWCESYAIPSKCYSAQDAAKLPDGVFTCNHKAYMLGHEDEEDEEEEEEPHAEVRFPTLVEHSPEDAAAPTPLCDKSVKQISGYFQIGNTDQHYFFWFFESRSKPSTDPLVMWLTGGPGCASELALFAENGPCSVDSKGDKTINNPYSWNSNANLLYVDQPAGTGFSYGSPFAAARNERGVARDLYLFLTAFLTKHQKYQPLDFFLFGESYAGHYVPATGHRIWLGNKRNEFKLKINLKGISVGNGMTNPQLQFPFFPQMAYNSSYAPSLVSKQQYMQMKATVPLCVKLIQTCNLPVAGSVGPSCAAALAFCETALISPISELGYNLYDMRLKCEKKPLCYDFGNVARYLNKPEVRQQLGVSPKVKKWEECSAVVSQRFVKDWMHNFHRKIPALIENGIPVMIYAGDQDYICNWLGNKAWALELKWTKQRDFQQAKDVDWNSGAGRIRRAGAFSFLQVYKAGHMVPMDQPKASLKMLNDFITNKGPWAAPVKEDAEVVLLLLLLLLLLLALAVCLAAATNAKRLAGYGLHFVVIQESGQAYAVGKDDYGQLGIGNGQGFQSFPRHVLNIKKSTDSCAGSGHTYIVDEGGQAKCGGSNGYGRIGAGSEVDKLNVLTAVPGLASGVDQVVCGRETSFALLTTGQVKAWGLNDLGQLGADLKTEQVYSPVAVKTPEGTKTVLVASGGQHTCFLASDGSVSCAGSNYEGQLSSGSGIESRSKPRTLYSLPGPIVTISCGEGHTCAVTKDSNQVYCWGGNKSGELGFTTPDDDYSAFYNAPILVAGVSGARSVMTGHWSTYVILNDTTAVAFGNDNYGQIGRGSTSDDPVGPTEYGNGVANILEIRGGNQATCMLNSAGDVLCAGKNDFGQLGQGGGGWDSPHNPVLTKVASAAPTKAPTRKPGVLKPTKKPTKAPSSWPTKAPTSKPTRKPTATATKYPTKAPTTYPTKFPIKAPTPKPTTKYPTKYPVKAPTSKPVVA